MVRIKTQTTDEIPSAEEGKSYEITDVDEFSSAVRGFNGLRVNLMGDDEVEAVEALWVRDVVGPKSKLGSFVTLLGKDTRDWIGKRIRFVSWKAGNREIALEPPKE